jgi:large subunit ribosomal protein L6
MENKIESEHKITEAENRMTQELNKERTNTSKEEEEIVKQERKLKEEIRLPDKVSASINGYTLIIRGPKGEVKREFAIKQVSIKLEKNKVIVSSLKTTKREKKIIGTFKAHIRNMVKGVSEGHKYILKICSGHFPMNVSVNNKEFIVKNFLGEKVPRVLTINEGVNVKVDGDFVIVEGVAKELTSNTAASIEQLCKIKNRDLRIFQDGCYIISKDGKELK